MPWNFKTAITFLNTAPSKGGLVWLFSANPSPKCEVDVNWFRLSDLQRDQSTLQFSVLPSSCCAWMTLILEEEKCQMLFLSRRTQQCEMCFTCNILAPNFWNVMQSVSCYLTYYLHNRFALGFKSMAGHSNLRLQIFFILSYKDSKGNAV